MTPKQKLKIRFRIISSIIFVGLIVLWVLNKNNPQIIDDWLLGSAYIIGIWFWFDKKLLYIRSQLIISLLLCLMFLFIVITTNHYYIATIPLASVTGRLIANKILDKERKIDLEAKDECEGILEGRMKMMIYFVMTAAISGIIYLVIKIVI
jgi:hypothetical protein